MTARHSWRDVAHERVQQRGRFDVQQIGPVPRARLVCLALSGGTTAVSAQAEDPVPVVIDSDMISDDWMAALFLLNDPGFSVKAITVSGTGFATAKLAFGPPWACWR